MKKLIKFPTASIIFGMKRIEPKNMWLNMALDQHSVRFFCKYTGNKYFWLCYTVLVAFTRISHSIIVNVWIHVFFLHKTLFKKWKLCSFFLGWLMEKCPRWYTDDIRKNTCTQVYLSEPVIDATYRRMGKELQDDLKAVVSLKRLPQQSRKQKAASLELST